jgi:hypothetical protein
VVDVKDFEPEEREIASVLAASFDTAADVLLAEINAGPLDAGRIESLLSDARLRFAEIVSGDNIDQISAIARRAVSKGAASFDPRDWLTGVPSVARVQQALGGVVTFYANRYFDEFVEPEIVASLATLVEETPVDEPFNEEAARGIFAGALSAKSYWVVLGSVVASRAWHYGYLKAAQLGGMRGYQWDSVVDAKTSVICEVMHGRKFWIADAVNLLEGTALSGDPEAARKHMAWRKADEVKDKTADALREMGFLVPPAHPHCRSKIRVF